VVITGTAPPSPEPPPGARRTHRVAQGDTLAKIAQQYGTTIDSIMRANNFTDRGRILRVGEELVIPAP
jgi:LysM repeat protein